MVKVFIDNSGWYEIVNSQSKYHNQATDYFQQVLEGHAKIYTNVMEVNIAIDNIKRDCGILQAQEFTKIVDESILKANIQMTWLARRQRKSSLKQLFSMREPGIKLSHCIIFDDMRRKKINVVFSFDSELKIFGFPLMPQV